MDPLHHRVSHPSGQTLPSTEILYYYRAEGLKSKASQRIIYRSSSFVSTRWNHIKPMKISESSPAWESFFWWKCLNFMSTLFSPENMLCCCVKLEVIPCLLRPSVISLNYLLILCTELGIVPGLVKSFYFCYETGYS